MNILQALKHLTPEAQWSMNADDYNQITWLSPDIPKPTLEEVNAKIEELKAAEPMRLLRIERDRLLAETDWISSKYYDLEQPVPEEWKSYRQALRDLPANTEDPTNPVWPTKPQ